MMEFGSALCRMDEQEVLHVAMERQSVVRSVRHRKSLRSEGIDVRAPSLHRSLSSRADIAAPHRGSVMCTLFAEPTP